jgi:hypothetical protein
MSLMLLNGATLHQTVKTQNVSDLLLLLLSGRSHIKNPVIVNTHTHTLFLSLQFEVNLVLFCYKQNNQLN